MSIETLRPLPILMNPKGSLPAGSSLLALQRAKKASGYQGLVRPHVALPGSPEPILAVGVWPDWLTRYAYVPDFSNVSRLKNALIAILINPDDPRMEDREDLLSMWLQGPVKYVGEEEYHGAVRFE